MEPALCASCEYPICVFVSFKYLLIPVHLPHPPIQSPFTFGILDSLRFLYRWPWQNFTLFYIFFLHSKGPSSRSTPLNNPAQLALPKSVQNINDIYIGYSIRRLRLNVPTFRVIKINTKATANRAQTGTNNLYHWLKKERSSHEIWEIARIQECVLFFGK